MNERTFKGICFRFFYALIWCIFFGLLLNFLKELPFPELQKTVKSIIFENLAPKSFNFIAIFSIISLSLTITILGRTENTISLFRSAFGYKATEISLSLAAVLYGLSFGSAIWALDFSLIFIGLISFSVSVLVLLALLWLSFYNNCKIKESAARIYSFCLAIISLGVAWYTYFR